MPAHTLTPSVVLDRVSFAWPDGSSALTRPLRRLRRRPHRTRRPQRLGQVHPAAPDRRRARTRRRDSISDSADVAYLPQRLTLDVDRPVAELLGVRDTLARAARDRVRRRRPAPLRRGRHRLGHRSARARRAGRGRPRSPSMLDRRVGELSGGEAVLTAIAGIRLRAAPHHPARRADEQPRPRRAGAAADMVRGWRGTLVVVSHDLSLLELMDDTAELYENELSVFGGPYSQWRAWLDAEQDAARQAEQAAAQVLQAREARPHRGRDQDRASRRRWDARRSSRSACRRSSRAGASARRRSRPASCAPRCATGSRRRATALDAAERRVRDDDTIRIDLPDPGVPAGRRIATIGDGERSWVIQGPERVALIGPNGVGKTTLLEQLVGRRACTQSPARSGEPTRDPRDPRRSRRPAALPA